MIPSGTPQKRRICLITSRHISYNPRLIKEADALAEAGHDVRVVAINVEPAKWEWDRRLMTHRRWRLAPLHIGRRRWLIGGVRQKLLLRAPRGLRIGKAEELAFSRYSTALARLAAEEDADLYIAHTLEALPAACRAAHTRRARLGFDAEDFHRGELPETFDTLDQRALVEAIEKKYIPRCDYVSAASAGIAREYARALDIALPHVILNTSALSERSGLTPAEELARERRGGGLTLYWYSQVIGPGRGVCDALRAVARLGGAVHLHLRGAWAQGFEAKLTALSRDLGADGYVHILPPAPPEQLVERSAQHDIGFAGESGHTANGRLAVSNKMLNYMAAGIAIVASDVPSQRETLQTCAEAGILYRPGDADALANALQRWVDDPDALQRAKAASHRCGEARYCWELEKAKLLACIEGVFGV